MRDGGRNPLNEYAKSLLFQTLTDGMDFDGKCVAICEQSSRKTIFTISCDSNGYPISNVIKSIEINPIKYSAISESDINKPITFRQTSFRLESPLVVIRNPYDYKYKVIAWKARLLENEYQNIDEIKTLDLQKIVNDSIERKTCKIIEISDNLKMDIESYSI